MDKERALTIEKIEKHAIVTCFNVTCPPFYTRQRRQ